MSPKFQEILRKCADKAYNWLELSNKKIGFQINGFSKSGTATLWEEDDGKIVCQTRYDQIDYIEEYDDIVRVAFDWYSSYSDRDGYSEPSSYWVDDFLRLGLIKTETKTVYKIAK